MNDFNADKLIDHIMRSSVVIEATLARRGETRTDRERKVRAAVTEAFWAGYLAATGAVPTAAR